MKTAAVIDHIVTWLNQYCENARTSGFITGISGGIDSAVTSTLCSMTGKTSLLVSMPIHQKADQLQRAHEHMQWLSNRYKNVSHQEIDLTQSFEALRTALPADAASHQLSMANTRARLRMSTLYAVGQAHCLLVAGTGNKIEDFGVGFYTKYGDGGVDLSPIADLTKTQVYAIARELGVVQSIQTARPTDGLWEEERTDEDQLGATYPELEWALEFVTAQGMHPEAKVEILKLNTGSLNPRQKEVIDIYARFHNANLHKMQPIPVCNIPAELMK